MTKHVVEIELDEQTEKHLKAISELYECSMSESIQTVLERYSQRAKNEIERVQLTVDRITKDKGVK